MERSWAGGTSRALRINAMLLLLQMEMLEVSANVSRRQEQLGQEDVRSCSRSVFNGYLLLLTWGQGVK